MFIEYSFGNTSQDYEVSSIMIPAHRCATTIIMEADENGKLSGNPEVEKPWAHTAANCRKRPEFKEHGQ
jgi:hypothetical protein